MIAAALALIAATPALPAPIRGDFDHDGREDVAKFVGDRAGEYRLVIERGAALGRSTAVFRTRQISGLYLDLARSGLYRTACDKGASPDHAPCSFHHVHLNKRSLVFGYEEASSATIVWRHGAFHVVWLTD